MQTFPLNECYQFLLHNRGWDSSNGQKATKEVSDLLKKLKDQNNLPICWYSPLLVALKYNSSAHIDSVLNAFSDIYCKRRLDFSINENDSTQHILIEIVQIISKYPKEICVQSAIPITRFSLGVINGELSIESPVHGEILLQYFQSIFNCTIVASEKTAQISSRTALTQAVEIIAQRFESPPIYTTDNALLAYQVARKITFGVLAPDLFDLLDNTAALPKPSNVYESDALLILRTLCSSSSISETKETMISNEKALISIELVTNFISYDHEVMYTSLLYLQIIKNFVCSLVLRHSHSESHRVFKATLRLCHALMMRYRDILKAESSVFFSSLFFRVLDQKSSPSITLPQTNSTQNPKLDKLSVIDQLERFSPSFLAEIFVNFDCDIDLQEANVFEHIITSLISLSEYTESLQTIAAIMKKLNNWSRQRPNVKKTTPTTALFEKTKKLKALYSKAIDDFNADPEHNLQGLIDSGLVKDDPKSVAQFFHSHRSLLSSTGVGLILGGSKPFLKSVMHEYVDMIDFSKMTLVESLYHFLSLFRLPPESQQIDRIIEKFAHAFYVAHPNEFPSASIVYDASFAAVILHTDAHNPQVTHKMQKNEFVKLYRGMDEGDALPTEFIESIYDYVVTHEIALMSNSSLTMSEDFRSPTQKGIDSYKQSLEHINEAQKRMRSSAGSEIRWVCPVDPDTVRPMFEAIWMPLNALASKILSEGGSEDAVSCALTILTSSIDISARFFMETESTVCMSTLCTFTRLQPWTPIRIQNIRAIRELLDMSTNFSSYFEPVWEKMLSLFAQINYFMLAHNTSTMSLNNMNNGQGTGTLSQVYQNQDAVNMNVNLTNSSSSSQLAEIAQHNAEIVTEFVPLADIDALFEASAEFPSTAIVPFVHALCKVSNNEFGQRPPRTFCLQKIVEVTAFNMERARFVWTQIWKPISQHLVEAGCFPQEGIARSALDSLRQLAGKFLAREELQSFHYQRDFLKPFHSILRKSKSKNVRLHALRCLNHTVHLYHEQMKSGWEAAFSMLESAATIAEVNRLALTVLIDILEQNLHEIVDEHLMEPAMRTVEKFSIIGRCITRSAIYVIAGIFEKMMKIDNFDAELDFKPVLTSLVKVMNDPSNVSIVLPIIKKSINTKHWRFTVPNLIIRVLRGKSSTWLDNAGKQIIEWAVPALCCNPDTEDLGVTLIVECAKVPNQKILSICAQNLTKILDTNDAAKEAATLIARGIIQTLNDSDEYDNVDLMAGLAADLAPCLDTPELKALQTSLAAFSKDVMKSPNKNLNKNSARAELSILAALLTKKETDISQFKHLCEEIFDRGDDGRKAAISAIMNLNDDDFFRAGAAISVKAAKLISTENDSLRQMLAKFFVRMSQDCFVEKK
ncbi:hypothetical protein TRFO_06174 [Tritrichomonas foetus]|uniref:SEC7 domain-containing protein n=1 Tax=Tritrichomonas foetus TaxID=1144522 RepID=A0A1J4K4Y5_9EUKA|nr:hypothetical protein TRFO_06174 [Tritrichomonas foetus]|eukprot:OHT04742.1 hypothetical protein TRFO_06174 [Tritrichomonas foetus]